MSDIPFATPEQAASHAERQSHAGHTEPHALGCPFCERHDLELTLAITDHFYVLADHAPLLEGHLLIVPHGHHACYGAVPAEYEAEFATIKRRVARFLATAYRTPTFFEHGVFRQTVFHAHLHALPFGPVALDLAGQARLFGGLPTKSLADLRDWYAGHGHYFYLEEAIPAGQTGPDTIFGPAAIFPPEMNVYSQTLGNLWRSGADVITWRSAQERFAQREPMLEGVASAWQAFVAAGG